VSKDFDQTERVPRKFGWIVHEIVQRPRPNPMSAAEISEAEISAAAARDEITKGKFEDEAEISAAAARDEITKGKFEDEFIPLNGCKDTDGPSQTPELIDLPPPNPGFLARSKPWRPVHQRPAYQRPVRGNWRTA
jgi:hypothetical protein